MAAHSGMKLFELIDAVKHNDISIFYEFLVAQERIKMCLISWCTKFVLHYILAH